MGEAKRRKASGRMLVYHHTSTLCTNLIWMSGAIEIEGQQEPPLHPQLGIIQTGLSFRRACNDFPPVVWFTTEISVPKCLVQSSLFLKNEDTRETLEIPISKALSNGIALHRIALGFPATEIPIKPWPRYYGYATPEGQAHQTARASGDEPDRWYLSEERVSLQHMTEIRIAKSMQDLKMQRNDEYLYEIKKLLAALKDERAYVPPTWLSPKDIEVVAARLNLKVKSDF
jgi:hypothetical protein